MAKLTEHGTNTAPSFLEKSVVDPIFNAIMGAKWPIFKGSRGFSGAKQRRTGSKQAEPKTLVLGIPRGLGALLENVILQPLIAEVAYVSLCQMEQVYWLVRCVIFSYVCFCMFNLHSFFPSIPMTLQPFVLLPEEIWTFCLISVEPWLLGL